MSEETERRPRRPHSQKRVRKHWIATLLNDAEYTHLLSQCEATGKNPSRLLRDLIAGVHLTAGERYDPPLRRAILSLANNWNQIARRVNGSPTLDRDDVQKMLAEMKELRRCLS